MERSIYHRSLPSGLLGAAVIVAAACSGSDRAVAGRDTTQTANIDSAAVDTQSTAVGTVPGADTGAATASRRTQPPDTPTRDTAVESKDQTTPGYQAMQEPAGAGDTSSRDTGSAEVAGAADTSRIAAQIGNVGERLDSSVAAGQATADSVAGQAELDRVRPPEGSSETLGAVTGTDTATVSVEADTIATAVQEDTIAAHADTSMAVVHADTTTADQQLEVSGDSVTADQQIGVTTDTATADQQPEVAVDAGADTVAVGDSAQVGNTGERLEANAASAEANADTLATETERVRPPEDSTEVLGNVTNQEQEAEPEPTDANADAAPVAAAGVQTTGNVATGAEAVSLMSRGGQPCTVVTGDKSEDAEWDMAASPATMNPCGTGSMTLPRVQLEKEAAQ